MPSASIWTNNENRATFSDVVAAQTIPDLLKPVTMDQRKNSLGHSIDQLTTRRSLNDSYGKRMMNKTKDDLDDMKYKRNSTELGPIGTRRQSPNDNQWEPMLGSIHQPTPTPFSTLPRSRFLDSFQQCNQVAEQVALAGGVDSETLMSRYSFFNDDQSLYLAMQLEQQRRQRQQQQQQQQLHQQQQQQTQNHIDSSWNTATVPPTSSNSSMWTPMGYSPPSIYQQQQQSHSQQSQQMSAVGSWPVRPPPGLSMNNNSNPGRSQTNPSTMGYGAEVNTNDTMTMSQNNGHEEMRTYDPFHTVSYLWQGGNDPWSSSSYSDSNGHKKQQ